MLSKEANHPKRLASPFPQPSVEPAQSSDQPV
jgi:hypothetical protein